jgi:hypothetical protein
MVLICAKWSRLSDPAAIQEVLTVRFVNVG